MTKSLLRDQVDTHCLGKGKSCDETRRLCCSTAPARLRR